MASPLSELLHAYIFSRTSPYVSTLPSATTGCYKYTAGNILEAFLHLRLVPIVKAPWFVHSKSQQNLEILSKTAQTEFITPRSAHSNKKQSITQAPDPDLNLVQLLWLGMHLLNSRDAKLRLV